MRSSCNKRSHCALMLRYLAINFWGLQCVSCGNRYVFWGYWVNIGLEKEVGLLCSVSRCIEKVYGLIFRLKCRVRNAQI